MRLGLLHNVEGFDRQDRKYAGHEIQYQSAQHGEQQQCRQRVLRFLDGLRQRRKLRSRLDLRRAGTAEVRGDLDRQGVRLRTVLFGLQSARRE